MDPAYYTWLIVGAIGMALGIFLHPRVILKVGVALFAIDVVGFAVAVMNSSDAVWYFGMGAIAIPILTAMTGAGAHLMRLILGKDTRKRKSSAVARR